MLRRAIINAEEGGHGAGAESAGGIEDQHP
jgi:hypothetical protein